MLKVIIADDEERVCSLIKLLPDWDALGMTVAGTAGNGVEALELVREIAPDILITDIRMPGCHGLELIERAKKERPSLQIVIISGYAHFEYAQSAIKLGVGDYLLKPIKKEELTATLQKLGERCVSLEQSANRADAQNRDAKQAQALLRESLLLDALAGGSFASGDEALCGRYSFSFGPGLYQAFGVKLDYNPEEWGETQLNAIRAKLDEMLLPALSAFSLDFATVVRKESGTAYGLTRFAPENQDQPRRVLRQTLNKLDALKGLFGAVSFTASLSRADDAAAEIPSLLKEAARTLDERLIEGTGQLLQGGHAPAGLQDAGLLERYGHALEKGLETLDVTQVVAATNELAHGAMTFPGVRGFELLELARAAGNLFALRLGLSDRLPALENRLNLCGRACELFDWLTAFEKEHMEAEDLKRRSEALRPIRVAKQYVQAHFCQSITLEDVCRATGFSVSYFSALFKKETGEGFSKYLTGVRMERAKELLQETDKPVSEICESVGYSDLKHFTQTFRKYANLSPAQYRKLYG